MIRSGNRIKKIGRMVKTAAQIGIFVALLTVGQNTLHDARDPDGVIVARLAVHHPCADHAAGNELVKLRLGEIHALFRAPCNVLRRSGGLKTHVHHYLAHIIADNRLKDSVLGIGIGDTGIGQAFKAYLRSKLQNIRSFCHFTPPLHIILCVKLFSLYHRKGFFALDKNEEVYKWGNSKRRLPSS